MNTNDLIDQIKEMPQQDRLVLYQFLSREFAQTTDARLYDEFTLIGSQPDLADVEFAAAAQAEVLRHG